MLTKSSDLTNQIDYCSDCIVMHQIAPIPFGAIPFGNGYAHKDYFRFLF